jgi:ABC-type nickel/cobalt efflux system permease component RcnA
MKSKRGLLPVSWSGAVARRAPYLSSILIILVGLYVAYQSWAGLATHAAKRARSG